MKYINEIREGEQVIEHYLCKSRQTFKSKNDKNYLSLKLADKTGTGGTDFRPAFEYVEELRQNGEFTDLKGMIYFTDGYGIYPERMPAWRTAFVFLEEDYRDADVPAWAIKLILREEDMEEHFGY